MVNYQNGKIYKIVSDSTDDVYVGSTTKKYLCNRMAGHRDHYKKWQQGNFSFITSFEILKHGDAKIFLLEKYPCNSKEELDSRERWYIDNTENCINKNKPGRTIKAWRKENENILRLKEKIYREKNKDRINDYLKHYRNKNRDKIHEKSNQKHTCVCGNNYTQGNKKRHLRSAKHQKWWDEQKIWLDQQMIDIQNKLKQIAIDKARYCS